VPARQQRETARAENSTTQAEANASRSGAGNPLRSCLLGQPHMRSAELTLAQTFNEAKLPAV
jgi:hypothetical protein